MSEKHLCIGLSLSPTWLNGWGWRKKDSSAERIFSADFYIDLTKKAEEAKLDFVFKPDALFLHPERVNVSPAMGGLDPTLLMTMLAEHTSQIGLVTTVSTTFNPPYVIARQLQTLHRLSEGRAGWNIVTSIEGGDNFGHKNMPSSEERYNRAKESVDVIRKLWRSYPAEALLVDRDEGIFADKDKIHPIDYKGDFYDVRGPLNLPAHLAGELPLFQAGASDAGREFASGVASGIFAATPTIESAISYRQDLRNRAKSKGRKADEIVVLPGLSLFLGNTTAEANALYRAAFAHLSQEQQLAMVRRILGLDLSGFAKEDKVTAAHIPHNNLQVYSKTHAELLKDYIIQNEPTVQQLLSRPEVISSAHWIIIGTVEEAAQQIEYWLDKGAMDGFIALPGGSIRSLQLFFDKLLPLLVEKGLFREEYESNTFITNLTKKKN